MSIKWPADGAPLSFEDISRPLVHAMRCAYDLQRKDRRRNIPWHGPEIGKRDRACSPGAAERLKAANLSYAEEDQGRDACTEIISLAVQLGIEQGRRISRSDESELLDKVNGSIFTLKVHWDGSTSLHTQSGLSADPVNTLQAAIGALVDEMARVQRCPRYRALAKATPEAEIVRGEKL